MIHALRPAGSLPVRRRPALLLALALSALLAVTAPGLVDPASSAPRPTVSVRASALVVETGSTVALRGRVRGGFPGQGLNLQRWNGERFVVDRRDTLSRTGRYRFRVQVPSGDSTWRVVLRAGRDEGRKVKGARSADVDLTGTDPVVPVDPELERLPAGPAAGFASVVDISADGRWVLLVSPRTDLTAEEDLNGDLDLFRWDRDTDELVLVSGSRVAGRTGNGGSDHGEISDDGQTVVFRSYASDLSLVDSDGEADAFLWRASAPRPATLLPHPEILAQSDGWHVEEVALSGNGETVALVEMPTSGAQRTGGRVYLYEDGALSAQVDSPANVVEDEAFETSGGLSLSTAGNVLVFYSSKSGLVNPDLDGADDVFRLVRKGAGPGTLEIVSRDPVPDTAGWTGDSYDPHISGSGRYVVFTSTDSELTDVDAGLSGLAGRELVWRAEPGTGAMRLVSTSADGTALADDHSSGASVDDLGTVAFLSRGTNLVAGDINGAEDAFVWTDGDAMLLPGDGTLPDDDALAVEMASDGGFVAFASTASNLMAPPWTGAATVYVWGPLR